MTPTDLLAELSRIQRLATEGTPSRKVLAQELNSLASTLDSALPLASFSKGDIVKFSRSGLVTITANTLFRKFGQRKEARGRVVEYSPNGDTKVQWYLKGIAINKPLWMSNHTIETT